jgi:hypothetical protein
MLARPPGPPPHTTGAATLNPLEALHQLAIMTTRARHRKTCTVTRSTGCRGGALVALVVTVCAACALLAAVAHLGSAQAACGGAYREIVRPPHRGVLPPLAIGDSTLILSLPTLRHEGISADARGCRQYTAGLALLAGLRRQGRLTRVVIVALGANGPVTETNVDRALAILGTRRVLVMVTHWKPGHRGGNDTALIRREALRHPGRIVVLDWIVASTGHAGWFQRDGLHLTIPGAAAFGRFLERAISLTTPHPKRV